MKIKVKNLGVLKQAEFELGDFTIICGENNTGKTYATYALYGFLYNGQEICRNIEINQNDIQLLLKEGLVRIEIKNYISKIQEVIEKGCKFYPSLLSTVFSTAKKKTTDCEFQVILEAKNIFLQKKFVGTGGEFKAEISKDKMELIITYLAEKDENSRLTVLFIDSIISNILTSMIFLRPFIISSERTGAATFRKELNFARSRLLETMSRASLNVDLRSILSNAYEDYALPIKTNLDFLQNLDSISKKSSFIAENYPDLLESFADIIGGKYTINDNGQLYYEPKGKRIKFTMNESSSAVRSLLDLGFYLRHEAQQGDLLMIDEPELNLHPENQRRVARLLARLVNLGIKVFITTHSDYIIKELNTLIMLNHDKPHLKRIAEVEGYQKSELLNADQIKVYIAEQAPVLLDGKTRKTKCQTLTPADIDPFMGIEARSFDKTIDTMNRIQSAIVWGED
jgi:ABC-type dipeptide/oligopeptide/nickel transport system ATPase component